MALNTKILRVTLALLLIFALTACTGANQTNPENIDNTVTHGESYDGSFDRTGINEVKFQNGVFYQIFVYNHRDSTGDGVGDLGGIIESLDYLDDLGINGIWLTPITHGASYHKYDVVDYYAIDPEFGTMDDFERLIKKAHNLGIKVIMDLVINHTSHEHPWFNASKADSQSEFRDYYHWASEDDNRHKGKGWHNYKNTQWHYLGNFWDKMPDLNYDNPKVRWEVKEIAKFWLDKGVDGFRLDAAKHLYHEKAKNHEFWSEFHDYLSELKEDVYLVGEVWDTPDVIAPYFANGLNVNFNFRVGERVATSINSGSDRLGRQLEQIYDIYSKQNPDFVDAPFLSNHDTRRIMSYFGGDFHKMKMAANVLLSLPGDPYIFAGEEIGMISMDDHMEIREPFKWYVDKGPGQTTWRENTFNSTEQWSPSVEEQQQDPESLLNHFKEMISIRQKHQTLLEGKFQLIDNDNNAILTFTRKLDEDTVIVAHNFSGEEQTITIEVNGSFTDFEALKPGASITQNRDNLTITTPALTSIFIYQQEGQ